MIDTLRDIRLLSELDDDEIAVVEKSCRWRTYGGGEQVIDQHSDTRDIFLVADGRVRVVNYSLSGREITFDDLEPGSHFGELAAIDGLPRSASVMALTDCLLAALPSERFQSLLKEAPDVAFMVMRDLAHIVRVATDRIMDLSTLAANNRVQAELLRQARSSATGDNTASIAPIPVHSDIASRVSTTRETVARVLGDLTRRKILARGKESLEILDVHRLEALVEEVRGE